MLRARALTVTLAVALACITLPLSATLIADAHARGLKVIPWTIDDPATMDYFMDLGVDGIITDYPNRLREVMAENGTRLPRPYKQRR